MDLEDDDIGLPRELMLSIGARVMVTHNISVALGLVNGTVAKVHDIMCGSNQVPSVVLLRVKKASATSDGYRGPSFLSDEMMLKAHEADPSIDPKTEAIIALSRWKSEIFEKGQSFQRQQFPLILAWYVCRHSSQSYVACI